MIITAPAAIPAKKPMQPLTDILFMKCSEAS